MVGDFQLAGYLPSRLGLLISEVQNVHLLIEILPDEAFTLQVQLALRHLRPIHDFLRLISQELGAYLLSVALISLVFGGSVERAEPTRGPDVGMET